MTERILIVDDDPDACSLIESMLGRLGYSAESTTSPNDALERVGRERYAAILTDLEMAEMSGLALCERLIGSAPNVPVIVVTGYASIETAISAMRVGAYDYLTKPLDAKLLGLGVARAVLAPVRRLTVAAEEVTETRDLSRRMNEAGTDEISRLAATFNTMLAALEESARAQRRLVSDASHELRTPLTSLRTNIEVLSRSDALPEAERVKLLHDVTEQLTEMTALIAELVELARGDQAPTEPEDVRLDLVAEEAIERTRRNRPGVAIAAELEETLVRGVPTSIERAVSNLLDNAAKWSPPGREVEVTVRGGEICVRDHGPGISDDDLPFVFDRFYRAPSARGLPGSGLGLAIVRQVAEAHDGTVSAERAEGGGTRMRLRLPPEHES